MLLHNLHSRWHDHSHPRNHPHNRITYSIETDGSYNFDFADGQGQHTYETYRRSYDTGGLPPPPR